jgi:hypothetical protein
MLGIQAHELIGKVFRFIIIFELASNAYFVLFCATGMLPNKIQRHSIPKECKSAFLASRDVE